MTDGNGGFTSKSIFSFPDPVNEVSARVVAAGALSMSLVAILFDLRWLTVLIAYGFVARVLTGPTLSPLGQLATRVITPRLPFKPRLVPGPPKRFAQGMGATITVAVVLITFAFDQWALAKALLGMLVVAASMEAIVGFCIGCKIFAFLMKLGVIPEAVCERCNEANYKAVTV